jgi:8-oxo-dGTP diphosphatase
VVTERARKLVVAGLIVGGDRRILITQRRADQALGGKWEFPGGKVEPGEAPVDALVRELREEIGVTVGVGRIWDVLFHAYPDFDLVMLVYPCRIVAGAGREPGGDAPRAVEVADLAWVDAGDLAAWDILPADRPLVERLRAEGVPPN